MFIPSLRSLPSHLLPPFLFLFLFWNASYNALVQENNIKSAHSTVTKLKWHEAYSIWKAINLCLLNIAAIDKMFHLAVHAWVHGLLVDYVCKSLDSCMYCLLIVLCSYNLCYLFTHVIHVSCHVSGICSSTN